MKLTSLVPLAASIAVLGALAGCEDSTGPRDRVPPAAPRGLYSVTGDHEAVLHWIDNTESDLAGYRIYAAPCATGSACPYDQVGSTHGTTFTVSGLSNGVTRHFAVAAFDRAGNESELSTEDIFDTPRPEGFGLSLASYLETPTTSGYDFSANTLRAFDDNTTDIFFGSNNNVFMIFTPFTDTEIQDAGYAASLDVIDYAPTAGWSPTGAVEAIPGHCYFVWTHDDHYAKFRVTSLDTHHVQIDWAYQTDPGNRELLRTGPNGPRVRRVIRWGS